MAQPRNNCYSNKVKSNHFGYNNVDRVEQRKSTPLTSVRQKKTIIIRS